jgi:hypothetical protein
MTIEEDRKRMESFVRQTFGSIVDRNPMRLEEPRGMVRRDDMDWLLSRLSLALDVVEAAKEAIHTGAVGLRHDKWTFLQTAIAAFEEAEEIEKGGEGEK